MLPILVFFFYFLNLNLTEGYRNLTAKYLNEEFNPHILDHPDVKYYCVLGGVEMTPLDVLYVPYSYIKAIEGL